MVLDEMDLPAGSRVASIAWNGYRHLELYYGVSGSQRVLHTINPRLHASQVAWMLEHAEDEVVFFDASFVELVRKLQPLVPRVRHWVLLGDQAALERIDGMLAVVSYESLLAKHSGHYAWPQFDEKAASSLCYTSGTTGNPKGALIPHRALIGNLTGFVCSQNWFGFDPFDAAQPSKAVFWSPADWAWTGGLMDALLPSLYFGRPIVAFNGRFSPEAAFEILQSHAVTHTFLFPTALKAMMKAVPDAKAHYQLRLQAMMSAGEAVGDAVFDYCQKQLGVTVNEMFGQTEINYVVGNCTRLWPAKPGSMGKGYPGHQVAVIDDAGSVCPPGTPGEVAVHRCDVQGQPDPVFFLGYWNNDQATQAKYTGDWCRTGDMAVADEDGYLWYQGRTDDMFKAAGYRIGPSEIENCLVKHPAVANAAVVPKPDAERGADVVCANLRFDGGAENPIAAALPDVVCLPLEDISGSAPVLALLFAGAGAASSPLDVNRAVQSATAASLRAIQVIHKSASTEAA